jgi:hypothetical protein
VYLLDHQYTPRNLAWSLLKHSDRVRGLALREAARRLDLEAFLCLADIHEVWQCEPEFSSYRSRRSHWSRWHDDDDDDDGIADHDEHNPIDLVDGNVDLRHWKDVSGKTVDFEGLRVSEDELCFTTANDALEPSESRYEGYMGNYGDTLERWYHRAAVVVWPHSHAFIVLVKTAPEQAMRELLDALGDDAMDETAQQKLEILLELWPRHARSLEDAAMPPIVLELALALDDRVSAATLLAPLAPRKVAMRSVRPLLSLVHHYGGAWVRKILVSWHDPPPPHAYGRPTWATYSPEWLARLAHDDPQAGLELARFVVERQRAELEERLAATTPFRSRSRYERGRERKVVGNVGAVLRVCTLIGARRSFRATVDRITAKDSALSPLELVTVADDLVDALDDEARATWGLETLLMRSREMLESGLASLRREDGNWSISVPQTCSCHDCGTLHEYLESPELTLEWPLAKDRRRHIHGAIDLMGLPVTHATRRRGSPYTLVLTKTGDLFQREAELRRQYEQSLARTDGHLDALRTPRARKGRKKRAKQR